MDLRAIEGRALAVVEPPLKDAISNLLSLRWARSAMANTQAWERSMHEGMMAFQDGKLPEAENAYASALKEARSFKEGDLRVTVSLDSLAGLYRMQGRFEEAEPLCLRALAIKERRYGAHHPNVASTLEDLAEINRALGRGALAVDYRRRALAILEQAIGPDFAELSESLARSEFLAKDEPEHDEP